MEKKAPQLNKLQDLKIAADLISDTIHLMTDVYNNCTAATQMAFGHQCDSDS